MTCKLNERAALNTRKTKKYFEENNVIAFKADRDKNSEVDPLLVELGNTVKAIPHYVIYRPGKEPVQFGATVFPTPQSFLDRFVSETEGANDTAVAAAEGSLDR